jgi:hypothetical protein
VQTTRLTGGFDFQKGYILLKFYKIDNNYIDYLRKYDSRIYENEEPRSRARISGKVLNQIYQIRGEDPILALFL